MDRRLKRLRVADREIVGLLSGLGRPTFPELPGNASVHHCYLDFARMCFWIVVYHPDWDEVDLGAELPEIPRAEESSSWLKRPSQL